MRHGIHFISTAILGGLAFLVPILLVFMLLSKGLSLTLNLAAPLATMLPTETVAGVAIAKVLALLLLILFCYLAGLFARLATGRSFVEGIESKLETIYPRYTVIKFKMQDLRTHESLDKVKVVLAKFDDNAAIGFEVERQEGGMVTVFLPGSPDPWAGTVIYMTPDRVEPLNLDVNTVAKRMKSLGKGTASLLS